MKSDININIRVFTLYFIPNCCSLCSLFAIFANHMSRKFISKFNQNIRKIEVIRKNIFENSNYRENFAVGPENLFELERDSNYRK